MREIFKEANLATLSDPHLGLENHVSVTISDSSLGLEGLNLVIRVPDLYIVGIRLSENPRRYAFSSDPQYKNQPVGALFRFDDSYNPDQFPTCSWLEFARSCQALAVDLRKGRSSDVEVFRNHSKVLAFFLSEAARFEEVGDYCYIAKRSYAVQCRTAKEPNPKIELSWALFQCLVTNWSGLSEAYLKSLPVAEGRFGLNRFYAIYSAVTSGIIHALILGSSPKDASTKVVPIPSSFTCSTSRGGSDEQRAHFAIVFQVTSERLQKDRMGSATPGAASVSTPTGK